MNNEILKQEIEIFMNKLNSLEVLKKEKNCLIELETMKLKMEKQTSQFGYQIVFFQDFLGILEHLFNLKDSKVNLNLLIFVERFFLNNDFSFENQNKTEYMQKGLVTLYKNETITHLQLLFDSMVKNFCTTLKNENERLIPRICKTVLKLFVSFFNMINSSTTSKVLCAFFLAYFNSIRDQNLKEVSFFIKKCIENIILFSLDKLKICQIIDQNEWYTVAKSKIFYKKSKRELNDFSNFNKPSIILKDKITVAQFEDKHIYCKKISLYIVELSIVNIHKRSTEKEKSSVISKPLNRCFNCQRSALYHHISEKLPLCSIECKLELDRVIKSLSSSFIPLEFVDLNENKLANTILTYITNLITQKNEEYSETNSFSIFMMDLVILFLSKVPAIFFLDKRNVSTVNSFLKVSIYDKISSDSLIVFEKCLLIFNLIIKNDVKYYLEDINWFLSQVLLKFLYKTQFGWRRKMIILEFISEFICDPQLLCIFILNYDLNYRFEELIMRIVKVFVQHSQESFLVKNYTTDFTIRSKIKKKSCEFLAILFLNFNKMSSYSKRNESFYDNFEKTATQNVNLSHLNKEKNEDGLQKNDCANYSMQNSFELKEKNIILSTNLCCNKKTSIEFGEKIKMKFEKKNNFQNLIIPYKESLKKMSFHSNAFVDYFKKESFCKKMALLILKRKIPKKNWGEYLSSDADESLIVFKEFIKMLHIEKDEIDVAFRKFLKYVKLPYASEKVDKVLRLFADNFAKMNALEISYDCAYGLLFLIVMLQTELHNPMVVDKMSVKRFISLSECIKDYNNFFKDSSNAIRIYESIKKKPLNWSDKTQSEKIAYKEKHKTSYNFLNISIFKEENKNETTYLEKKMCVSNRPFFQNLFAKQVDCHHKQYSLLRYFFKSEVCAFIVINLLINFNNQEEFEFIYFETLILELVTCLINTDENELLIQLFMSFIKFSEINSSNSNHVLSDKNIFFAHLLLKLLQSNFFEFWNICGTKIHSFLKSFERFSKQTVVQHQIFERNSQVLHEKGLFILFDAIKENMDSHLTENKNSY